MSRFRETVLAFAVISIFHTHCVLSHTDSVKEKTLTFERTCTSDYSCRYENAIVGGQVYLACNDGKCQCRSPRYLVQDAPHYPVKVVNGNCVASYNAPCGTDYGLKIVCASGNSCIEGRCRPGIRTKAKYSSCDEDIDCEEGLTCNRNVIGFSSYHCH